MESLFFNTPTQRYKTTKLFRSDDEYLTKIDISNGIFFYDTSLKKPQSIQLKNLDRMVMIPVIKQGSLTIQNHAKKTTQRLQSNSITIYCSSRQNFSLIIEGEVFILFIADFFLKQYLSFNPNEPIDFLYNKIQGDLSLEQINQQPIDALSLYIIEKIRHTKEDRDMHSIRCMHRIIELIIHRLSLLDMIDEGIKPEELEIASRAKGHLLESFTTPPTIKELAHLCATNESKIKRVFKKVYKTTIYGYIQKLRLEEANLLLREQDRTIGEIAKMVGYRHQGHFSKLFFEVYGVYPKDLLG